MKKEILKYLCEDFKNNQAIFNKQYGWQVFNDTDLEMVMDKVVGGLYSGMRIINEEVEDGRKRIISTKENRE